MATKDPWDVEVDLANGDDQSVQMEVPLGPLATEGSIFAEKPSVLEPPTGTVDSDAQAFRVIFMQPMVTGQVTGKLTWAHDLPSWGDVPDLSPESPVYQRVKGTSTGSIYVVAVKFRKMTLALRHRQTSTSIRFSGGWQEYSGILQEFKVADHGGYASVHITVTFDEAVAWIGALMARIGFEEVLVCADLRTLKGVGK